MPELRKDPVLGRWVIISTGRSQRPSDFEHRLAPRVGVDCPFCPGREHETPPELLAIREPDTAPNTPGWSLRVVSNKYPALMIEGDLDRTTTGVYDHMNGIGAHEVVIEAPEHDAELAHMPTARVTDVLIAFRERMRDLCGDRRFRYVLVFKNHGARAGATLEHAHAQIIATPIVPKRVQEEIEGAFDHHRHTDRCIFCDVVTQERNDHVRLVTENDKFVAFAPFASRFPFETWLLPKKHQSHFEDATDSELQVLAGILRSTLHRIDRALDEPAYNFVLHTAPTHDGPLEYYHWHFEIMPRLTNVAGFEWGTGFYINSTAPEQAAATLREIDYDGERARHAHDSDLHR